LIKNFFLDMPGGVAKMNISTLKFGNVDILSLSASRHNATSFLHSPDSGLFQQDIMGN